MLTEQPDPSPEFVATDEDFHVTLSRAAGNQVITQTLITVNARIRPVRMYDFLTADRIDRTIREHLGVVEAVLAAQIDDAEIKLREHVGNWFNDMTSGYGFVAVAVVLFATWRPLRVLGGAYLFGMALAAVAVLQVHGVSVNQYLLDAAPYLITLITLIALVTVGRRGSTAAPEALTRALARAG